MVGHPWQTLVEGAGSETRPRRGEPDPGLSGSICSRLQNKKPGAKVAASRTSRAVASKIEWPYFFALLEDKLILQEKKALPHTSQRL
jgi:hypothetical protein